MESLLNQLRTMTVPFTTKLDLVTKALAAPSPSPTLHTQLRDFILDLFLRSRSDALLIDHAWWVALQSTLSQCGRVDSRLPIFTTFASFLSKYSAAAAPHPELLTTVLGIMKQLLGAAMRKSSIDTVLDGLGAFWTSTKRVLERDGEDAAVWEDLGEVWLGIFKGIGGDSLGKSGKKIPLHILANLSSILPILTLTSTSSSRLHELVLNTVGTCLFSVDHLRRGMARETYNQGGAAGTYGTEGAVSELLVAIKGFITEGEKGEEAERTNQVLLALPPLFTLYLDSLSTNSTDLFPLPAKTAFPTPAAHKSASELHALNKTRSSAGVFVNSSLKLLRWEGISDRLVEERSMCLAALLEEVEKRDLCGRGGGGYGWETVLEAVVRGALRSLSSPSTGAREGLMYILDVTMRLSFDALEPSLDSILALLAAAPPPSTSTTRFLQGLLNHHARSFLVPSLLLRLSTACSSADAIANSVLTTPEWNEMLEAAIGGLVRDSVEHCWKDLVSALKLSLPVSTGNSGDEPRKKRRKLATTTTPYADQATSTRVRLLTLFVRGAPSFASLLPLLSAARTAWMEDLMVNPGTEKEVLGLWYEVVRRCLREGLYDSGWRLGPKRLERIGAKLTGAQNDPDLLVVVIKTILQSLSFDTSPSSVKVTRSILSSVLAFIATDERDDVAWDGNLRQSKPEQASVILWELITRRWLPLFEYFGTVEHLETIASLVVSSLSSAPSAIEGSLTFHTITLRLLRRADFYEATNLRGAVQSALQVIICIPSLSEPQGLLESLPKVSPDALQQAIATLSNVTSIVPFEYLTRTARIALLNSALGLDLWVSSEVNEEERAPTQVILREFVKRVVGVDGAVSVPDIHRILMRLIRGTAVGSLAVPLTLELYQRSAMADQTQMQSFIIAFEKPLANLSIRSKSGVVALTCEELAFFVLCRALSTRAESSSATQKTVIKASKAMGKILGHTVASIKENAVVVFETSEIVRGCLALWELTDTLRVAISEAVYSNFAQVVLGYLVRAASSKADLSLYPKSEEACLAILDLLSFRLVAHRVQSDPDTILTEPFVTLLACGLVFRGALDPKDDAALENCFKRATSLTTPREYQDALSEAAAAIGNAVTTGSQNLAQFSSSFAMASVLLRDGPEGSSRLSGTCFSEILRHISLLLLAQTSTGPLPAAKLLVVVHFVEGICDERPMLLSRQNVSTVLALVGRILQPSGSTAPVASTTPATATPSQVSELFCTLVSVVDMLVRHRKDHIAPLFQHLVAAITALLHALRRAGYGTAGSIPLTEDGDSGIALGRRAEREARATFPLWVWEGGSSGIGSAEARAFGRLLGSLTAKTTATRKRQRDNTDKGVEAATTSLSAPLSKHAPFLLLPYVRASADAVSPIPSALRSEMQRGWFEVMEVMGKWEREALLKGFLGDDEEAERGVLRSLWKAWEKERYRG